MKLSEQDMNKVIRRYTQRYEEFGYSPKTLGWDKGKQSIRFDVLSSFFDFSNNTVLDIGCGFGDLNQFLHVRSVKNYSYLGIDVVPVLINEAHKLFKTDSAKFMVGDFLTTEIGEPIDIAIGSGIFNFKLDDSSNIQYIKDVIKKAFDLACVGVAFDFLSDKVDYQYEHTFHANPAEILDFAYSLSRNVVLRNDYMPFEFSLCVYKDSSFSKDDTVFNCYKHKNDFNDCFYTKVM